MVIVKSLSPTVKMSPATALITMSFTFFEEMYRAVCAAHWKAPVLNVTGNCFCCLASSTTASKEKFSSAFTDFDCPLMILHTAQRILAVVVWNLSERKR